MRLLHLSAHGCHRVLKPARTVDDPAGAEVIGAPQCRPKEQG
jgi:hypothetical protein